jgi:hypothetical protein
MVDLLLLVITIFLQNNARLFGFANAIVGEK